MDGNSAKKAPILDHLVDTPNTTGTNKSAPSTTQPRVTKPILTAMKGVKAPSQTSAAQVQNFLQNRHTDKSEFEIELARTVNKIMLKHFEHASEEIVQQVLSEVRARLPGRKKN